jgi:hypothetical protein
MRPAPERVAEPVIELEHDIVWFQIELEIWNTSRQVKPGKG